MSRVRIVAYVLRCLVVGFHHYTVSCVAGHFVDLTIEQVVWLSQVRPRRYAPAHVLQPNFTRPLLDGYGCGCLIGLVVTRWS